MRRVLTFAIASVLVAASGAVDGNADEGSSDPQARNIKRGNGGATTEIEKHDNGTRKSGYDGVVETKHLNTTRSVANKPEQEITWTAPPCDSNPDGSPTQWAIEHTICTPLNGVPPTPGPNRPAPENAQAQAIAFTKDYFRQIDIPRPQPEISAKDGGICGAEHTLDLHMQPEMIFKEGQTPFGNLTFHVYGDIKVNWGDGQTNTYTDGGAPYPKSTIKHVWTTKGFYNITATANWTADFTLGPYQGITYQGTLTGITTQGQINDFRVWDVQAVLTG